MVRIEQNLRATVSSFTSGHDRRSTNFAVGLCPSDFNQLKDSGFSKQSGNSFSAQFKLLGVEGIPGDARYSNQIAKVGNCHWKSGVYLLFDQSYRDAVVTK